MYFVYPATVEEYDDEIRLSFLDFDNCNIKAKSEIEAMEKASEVLGEVLLTMELNEEKKPEPTKFGLIDSVNKTLVGIDLDLYKQSVVSMSVRKSVTIPSWLNQMSIKRGLNFSKVLQEGLKRELNLE